MDRRLLRNCLLLDPEAPEPVPAALLIEGDRIAARLGPGEPAPEEAERVDLGGRAVAPGFVDLHFHGSAIFHDASGLDAALRRDAASLLRHGTTAFLTTTVSCPAPQLGLRLEALARAVAGVGGDGATPLGIHLEGPWIQPGAAGAHAVAGIRPFDPGEADALLGAATGLVRMVTLAPEVEGASELVEKLVARGLLAALGHSLATAEEVDDAVQRGARHVTHLFNAMGPAHHRQPGLAGAALSDDRLSCDLICDGVHVDPRWVRVAARAKGEQLLLISDQIAPPPGADFGSGPLTDDGRVWRLADGRLAGSRLGLASALHCARDFGAMTRLEAVAACSLRPARCLGVEAEHGTLRTGARADLVVLGEDDAVAETWVAGRPLYTAD